ncbi:putative Golgi apparatus membrane protein-like protein 1 [Diplonema papillatum]|nr:putative Golgi apparatus membrane protein-like protein 1 [Diplonema papillatum]
MRDPHASSTTQETSMAGFYSGNHKKTALFHVLFKVAALAVYFIGKHVWDDFVMCFIIIILLSAADFWVVKNVSGRVLVALRWWNNVKDNGDSEWVYESVQNRSVVKTGDSTFFWTTLFGYVIVWALLFVVNVLSVEWSWLPVCAVGIVLGGTNAYGYAKCKKGWKKQAAAYAMRAAAENPEMAVAAVGVMAGAQHPPKQQQQSAPRAAAVSSPNEFDTADQQQLSTSSNPWGDTPMNAYHQSDTSNVI